MLIRYRVPFLLAGVVVFGLLLRMIQFGQVPVSLYWDEMAIWNDAQSIIHTGRDLHNRSWFQPLFISYGDYKLPVYIWGVALSSLLSSDMFISTRLPSLVAGIICIVGGYFVAYWLAKNTPSLAKNAHAVGLFTSFVVAVLPWSIHFSRVGYEGHLSASLVVLSMWVLLSSFQERTWLRQSVFALVSVLLGSVAVYTYFSTRFVWPILFIVAVLLWARRWKHWVGYALALGLWMLVLIPMYRADFYRESNQFRLSTSSVLNDEQRPHKINFWREKSGNTLVSRILYNQTTDKAIAIMRNGLQHLNPEYLFLTGDRNLRHGTGFSGILFWWMAPFLVIGLVSIWRFSWKIGLFLSVWWAISLLPASVPLDVPHALRSLNALPAVAAFVGFGLWRSWDWVQRQQWPKTQTVRHFGFLVVLALVTTLSLVGYVIHLVGPYKVISATEWQDGYLQAAEYIAQQRESGRYDYIYIKDFDDRFFLYYQPFSDLEWSEIQRLPSSGFQRSTFERVRMGAVDDWESLEDNSLVISRRSEVPHDWKIYEHVTNTNGEETFVSVETVRNR